MFTFFQIFPSPSFFKSPPKFSIRNIFSDEFWPCTIFCRTNLVEQLPSKLRNIYIFSKSFHHRHFSSRLPFLSFATFSAMNSGHAPFFAGQILLNVQREQLPSRFRNINVVFFIKIFVCIFCFNLCNRCFKAIEKVRFQPGIL